LGDPNFPYDRPRKNKYLYYFTTFFSFGNPQKGEFFMAGLQEFCRAVARIFSLCVRFIIWCQPQIDIDQGLAFIILLFCG